MAPRSSLLYAAVTALTVHRFQEIINGRPYQIEVSNVGRDRWRAQLRRAAGGSGALMPFYGKTPDEAAGLLSHWLSVVNRRTADRDTPVD